MTKQEIKEIRDKFLKVDLPCDDEGCDNCPNYVECHNISLAIDCLNNLLKVKNKGELK